MLKNKQLGVGIIGCGHMGVINAEFFSQNPQVVLKACSDVDQKSANSLAKKYKINLYTNYKNLIERADVDLVYIATPHYLHAKLIREALQKNKHVLTEKPLGINFSEIKYIITLIKRKKKQVGVMLQYRFDPKIKFVLEKMSDLGTLSLLNASLVCHRPEEYY